jgi:hypothetical protein
MTVQAARSLERDKIEAMILSRANAIRARGATALYLYGSRARGDHRPDSDHGLENREGRFAFAKISGHRNAK